MTAFNALDMVARHALAQVGAMEAQRRSGPRVLSAAQKSAFLQRATMTRHGFARVGQKLQAARAQAVRQSNRTAVTRLDAALTGLRLASGRLAALVNQVNGGGRASGNPLSSFRPPQLRSQGQIRRAPSQRQLAAMRIARRAVEQAMARYARPSAPTGFQMLESLMEDGTAKQSPSAFQRARAMMTAALTSPIGMAIARSIQTPGTTMGAQITKTAVYAMVAAANQVWRVVPEEQLGPFSDLILATVKSAQPIIEKIADQEQDTQRRDGLHNGGIAAGTAL
jgi:hypothetical protein